jgi:hypothetical protein
MNTAAILFDLAGLIAAIEVCLALPALEIGGGRRALLCVIFTGAVLGLAAHGIALASGRHEAGTGEVLGCAGVALLCGHAWLTALLSPPRNREAQR